MKKTNRNIILSSIIIIAISWIYTIIMYNKLPEKVVGHMDLSGNITRYDDKYIIWVVMILFTGLTYGIYWFSNKTNLHNIRIENKTKQKTATLLTMPFISIVCFILIYLIINKSMYPNFNTIWFAYFLGGFTILFLIILFTYTYKNIAS